MVSTIGTRITAQDDVWIAWEPGVAPLLSRSPSCSPVISMNNSGRGCIQGVDAEEVRRARGDLSVTRPHEAGIHLSAGMVPHVAEVLSGIG